MILAAKLMMFTLACLVLISVASDFAREVGDENRSVLLITALFAAASIFVAGAL